MIWAVHVPFQSWLGPSLVYTVLDLIVPKMVSHNIRHNTKGIT